MLGGERGVSAGVGETPAGAFAWEWDLSYLHIDKPFKELKRTNTQDLSLSLMESWGEVWHDRSTVLSLGWFAISSSVPSELKREIELLVFGHHKGP